jgi:hypothetical protein
MTTLGPKAQQLRGMREAKASKQGSTKPFVKTKVLGDKIKIKSVGKLTGVKASKRP